MKFTYEAYRNLIDKIKEKYTIANYHNYNQYSNPCILRHDVDMDLDQAVRMACFEHDKCSNVRATYFILVSSDFYNVFSKESLRKIESIIEAGHEIGLHFDEVKYGEENGIEETRENIIQETKILSEMIGKKVTLVSMHRPSAQILDANLEIPGIINSYQKKFFSDFKYLSDSRMHWRENVGEIISAGEYHMLHILTHPFWYAEKEESMHDKLQNFCKKRPLAAYHSMDDNFRNLSEVLTSKDI